MNLDKKVSCVQEFFQRSKKTLSDSKLWKTLHKQANCYQHPVKSQHMLPLLMLRNKLLTSTVLVDLGNKDRQLLTSTVLSSELKIKNL